MHHKTVLFTLLNILVVNGLITTEGEFENQKKHIKFDDPHVDLDSTKLDETQPGNQIKFTDDKTTYDKENIPKDPNTKYTNNNMESDNKVVIFEDNEKQQNIANESNNIVKKPLRKRKRRPRQQVNDNYGFVSQGMSEGQTNFGAYRPKRRKRLPRKPSLMEQTSSTLINTLTSISLYDDQQCIPKLLCDTTAGRKGGFSGGSMLQGILDLQPLMTLLLAYNGATASPLFSFGRAIIMGMSASNHNPYVCQKSYPLCPSDPEKLVHYLNNHNGGLFRFFNNINNPENNINSNHQQQSVHQFLGPLSNAPQGFDPNFYVPQRFGLGHNFNQFGYPTNHFLDNQHNVHPVNLYQIQNAYGNLKSQNHVINYKNLKGDFNKEIIGKESKELNIESRIANDLTQDNYDITTELLSKYTEAKQNNNLNHSININRRILTKSPEADDDDEEDKEKDDEAFGDIPKWLLPDNGNKKLNRK